MKKVILLALALTVSAMAQERTAKIGEPFIDSNRSTIALKGCVRESATVARCDFTLTGVDADRGGMYFASMANAIFPNGSEVKGSRLRFGNSPDYKAQADLKVRKDMTYPLSLRFEGIPQDVTSIQYLDIYSRSSVDSNGSGTTRISNILLPTLTATKSLTVLLFRLPI